MHDPALRSCYGPAAALAMVPPPAGPAAASRPLHPLRLAYDALRQGQADAALAAFDLALRREPDLALAHLGRAVCLAQRDDDEGAADALARALAAPGAEHVVTHLAAACAREGHGGLAMDLLARVGDARPDLVAALVARPAFRDLRDHPRFLQMTGRL